MGKWFTFERVTAVWALALGTTALLTIFVGLGIWISDNSANVASWVQAVGSIGAIAAGFGVASFQFTQADRREREKNTEADRVLLRAKCLAFAYRLRLFSGHSTAIVNGMDGATTLWVIWKDNSKHLLEQLGAISASEFPFPETALEMSELRSRLMALYAILSMVDVGSGFERQSETRQRLEADREFPGWKKILHEHAVGLSVFTGGLSRRYLIYAKSISTDNEILQMDRYDEVNQDRFKKGQINPSDTGKPQTPQPPAASQ